MHKNISYFLIIFLLVGCAVPTSSINTELTPKNEYLFYVDEKTNLHASELLQTIQLPSKDYPVPEYLNLLPNALREYRSGSHQGIDFAIPLDLSLIHI